MGLKVPTLQGEYTDFFYHTCLDGSYLLRHINNHKAGIDKTAGIFKKGEFPI